MPTDSNLAKRSMRVGFMLRRRERGARLERSLDAGSWVGHTLMLNGLDDVDDQLIGWLAEAYACKL